MQSICSHLPDVLAQLVTEYTGAIDVSFSSEELDKNCRLVALVDAKGQRFYVQDNDTLVMLDKSGSQHQIRSHTSLVDVVLPLSNEQLLVSCHTKNRRFFVRYQLNDGREATLLNTHEWPEDGLDLDLLACDPKADRIYATAAPEDIIYIYDRDMQLVKQVRLRIPTPCLGPDSFTPVSDNKDGGAYGEDKPPTNSSKPCENKEPESEQEEQNIKRNARRGHVIAAAVTSTGLLVYVDSSRHTVDIVTEDGVFVREIGWNGAKGSAFGQFHHPCAVMVDEHDRIYVHDRVNHRIQVFNVEGLFLGAWGAESVRPNNETQSHDKATPREDRDGSFPVSGGATLVPSRDGAIYVQCCTYPRINWLYRYAVTFPFPCALRIPVPSI